MRFALACTLLVILSAAPALAQFDSATVVGIPGCPASPASCSSGACRSPAATRAGSDMLAGCGSWGQVHIGHAASHIKNVDTVVVSTAIRDSNLELARRCARACG